MYGGEALAVGTDLEGKALAGDSEISRLPAASATGAFSSLTGLFPSPRRQVVFAPGKNQRER